MKIFSHAPRSRAASNTKSSASVCHRTGWFFDPPCEIPTLSQCIASTYTYMPAQDHDPNQRYCEYTNILYSALHVFLQLVMAAVHIPDFTRFAMHVWIVLQKHYIVWHQIPNRSWILSWFYHRLSNLRICGVAPKKKVIFPINIFSTSQCLVGTIFMQVHDRSQAKQHRWLK